MKKNNGFFLVSLWTAIAIGAVCCVAITSKAHKVTIREMRDRAYAETVRSTKEIACNVRKVVITNLSFVGECLSKGTPHRRISNKKNKFTTA